MRTIFLIGPRGSGKSSVAKLLAARLSLPFRDTDSLVEAAANMRIAELVAAKGWPAFRELERAMLAVPPEVFERRRRQFETMKKNREQDEALRPKPKAKRREKWKKN